MRSVKLILVLFILNSFQLACSSKPLKVVTEPEQAEIFYVDSNKEEKKIGVSPFVKKQKEIKPIFADSPAGSLVQIAVKKEGFEDKYLWLPLNVAGSLGANLNVSLTPEDTTKKEKMAQELDDAKNIVKQLFKAQKYARSKQAERALIEIDRVLEAFPDFDLAVAMKGAILYSIGDFKESLVWYDKALDLNSDMKTALDMSAKIRKKLGRSPRLPAQARNKKRK